MDEAGGFAGGFGAPMGGTRIGIVGAGPAGSLLALALVDAARARHRRLSVSLFGASPVVQDPRLILADADAILRLGALGAPVPAAVGNGPQEGSTAFSSFLLRRLRCVVGGASFEAPTALFALPRAELVGGLRAAATASGVRTVPRPVESITRGVDGSWTLRSSGASERMDLVVLACGTGAAIACHLEPHVPPPLWRGCLAELELGPELAASLGGALHWIAGDREHPSLRIVPWGRRALVLAAGPDVSATQTAAALCRAFREGHLRGACRLRNLERVLLPAGSGSPSIPAIGGALGGAPGWSLLGTAATQAQSFAAAVIEEGVSTLLPRCRKEAGRLGRLVREPRMRSPLLEFGPDATSRALERARGEGGVVPGDHPVAVKVAGAVDPRPDVSHASRASRLRAFLLLLVAGFLALISRVLRRRPAKEEPASRIVYVVDDDPDHASLIGAALGGRGIAYRTFGDGLEAISAASRERPAAAVVDLGLPWLDGARIGGYLEGVCGAKVLLSTALPHALTGAGATSPNGPRGRRRFEVLTKPLDPERLADRLQECLPRAPADPAHRRRSG